MSIQYEAASSGILTWPKSQAQETSSLNNDLGRQSESKSDAALLEFSGRATNSFA